MLTSWLSTWWRKERRRSVSPRRTARLPYRTRLQVESLEDRCLMSNAYLVTNLVSDQPGVAKIQDTNLVNSWGLDAAPGGPWWVADNGTGVSTLYDGNTGQPIPLVVNIPLADGSPSAPTLSCCAGLALAGRTSSSEPKRLSRIPERGGGRRQCPGPE